MLGLQVRRAAATDPLPENAAVVSFSAVDYRTGELWDLAGITSAAQQIGAVVVWDLCHAAGVMPIELDGLGAELAVGCAYKYLNGGPGAPAWIYLARRIQSSAELPLTGWHGRADPFGLHQTFLPADGIARARIGTPPVLSMLALQAALEVWDEVNIADVRAKSLALTDLAISRADAMGLEVVTPRQHHRRGSQVALRLPHACAVCRALIARGVIGDFRAPDLLRLGFAPLYLSFGQVADAMGILADVLASRTYLDHIADAHVFVT
jgi:kynureninase